MELTPELILSAYAQGYFPMGQPGEEEILWFNPDPRAVLPLDRFHLSRSMARELKRRWHRVSFNEAFSRVMRECAAREETWITEGIFLVYGELHRLGFAHSVEVWDGEDLVGGTYGVSLGAGFFAESKFHRRTNASKIALYYLVKALNSCGYQLLEVQFLTDHLKSLGAIEIPKAEYLVLLKQAIHSRAASFPDSLD